MSFACVIYSNFDHVQLKLFACNSFLHPTPCMIIKAGTLASLLHEAEMMSTGMCVTIDSIIYYTIYEMNAWHCGATWDEIVSQ